MKTQGKIKTGLTLLGLLFCLGLSSQEQQPVYKNTIDSYDYKNAIGLRIGQTSGLTYKHFFRNGNAFEGILGAWPYKVGLTGLYEKHFETGAPGLRCYVGAGGHANIGETERVYYVYYNDYYAERHVYRSDGYAFGVDGIIGVEYKFRYAPLSLSADLKPFTEINDYGYVSMYIDPSLGVKFAF